MIVMRVLEIPHYESVPAYYRQKWEELKREAEQLNRRSLTLGILELESTYFERAQHLFAKEEGFTPEMADVCAKLCAIHYCSTINPSCDHTNILIELSRRGSMVAA